MLNEQAVMSIGSLYSQRRHMTAKSNLPKGYTGIQGRNSFYGSVSA
jgi:hypothetical protein